MLNPTAAPEPDVAQLTTAIRDRLSANRPLRRGLPGGGTLRIDRQLPFLCVYRRPRDSHDLGTSELVTTEAAYLVADGAASHAEAVARICREVLVSLKEHFGIVLVLEVWALPDDPPPRSAGPAIPRFEVVIPDRESLPTTIAAFTAALESVSMDGQRASVTVRSDDDVAPPGLPPLLERAAGNAIPIVVLGLAVGPVFRAPGGEPLYPLVLQRLRTQLSRALRQAVLAFAGRDAAPFATSVDALGPSTLSRTARLVDQQLCEISESFDFVLQATPVNAESAWQEFLRGGCTARPTFYYRPLPYDPALLKRRLYEIPIEDIEDPTLGHLFSQKQDELDRQLSGLRDLETPDFQYDSLQLYGEPDEELTALADRILATRARREDADDMANLDEVVARAREEIDYYHSRQASFSARVEVRDDIAAGLMVAQGTLLIAESISIARRRLEPLLHHEVGTHLLTYFNGRNQPLRQFYAGLAGAEGLQEGLAVLAEHLTGGLTRGRLRTLAARVIAVHSLLAGRTFVETYRLLHDEHDLAARTAFVTTLRAFRGGGLTKDIIYLRGARDLLQYLRAGHDLEPLFSGKLALEHVPFVQELRRRGVAVPPSLLPRYWEHPRCRDRLEAVRMQGVADLMEGAL